MKLKKTDYIAILVLVATLVQLIIVYPQLPDQVVTNWGTGGNVTYGSKSNVWMLWGINAIIFPGFFIIPKIDPKGKSYNKVAGFYAAFRLIMVLFMAGTLELVILSAEDAHRFNVGKIVMIATSLLMIFIGNYLPKCKQNYTLGIKTMWTLSDERVWNDTHRLGGILLVIAGIIGLVSTVALPESWYVTIFVGALIISIGVTLVYSYISYKKYNKQ